MTLGELLSAVKVSNLWAIGAAIVSLVVGSFLLGIKSSNSDEGNRKLDRYKMTFLETYTQYTIAKYYTSEYASVQGPMFLRKFSILYRI